jgi:ATP-binding cassette subfamily B protein
MKEELQRLWRVIPQQRRNPMLAGVLLLLVSSLLEGLSAAAVVPLLLGLMGRAPVGWGPLPLVLGFCLLVLLAGLVRLASLAWSNRLVAAVGSDLAERALAGVLALPYPQLAALPASQVVALLAPQLRQLINGLLLPLLQLISSAVLLLALALVLLLLAWGVVWPTLLLMLLVYGSLSQWVRPRLQRNGEMVVAAQQESIRLVQQTLGGLRELRLLGLGPTRLEHFAALDRAMRRQEAENITLGGLPRYVLEPAAMVAIALVGAFSLARGDSALELLPRLGLLAYGAQRLLPLGQQFWSAWSAITGGRALLLPLLPLLEQPLEPKYPLGSITFKDWQLLELRGVCFSHGSDAPPLLHGLQLAISPGEWLAVVGPSGSGKSTALDLLMGLLEPQAGQLWLDGKPLAKGSPQLVAWQRGIAFACSQPPLLAGTVREAIQTELKADPAALAAVVTITGMPELLDRSLGEQGQALSTGQLQRLGLARALLSNPRLLVLDEATSAIDLASEAELLKRLRRARPRLAVVLVSHRAGSSNLCDRTINLTKS